MKISIWKDIPILFFLLLLFNFHVVFAHPYCHGPGPAIQQRVPLPVLSNKIYMLVSSQS